MCDSVKPRDCQSGGISGRIGSRQRSGNPRSIPSGTRPDVVLAEWMGQDGATSM